MALWQHWVAALSPEGREIAEGKAAGGESPPGGARGRRSALCHHPRPRRLDRRREAGARDRRPHLRRIRAAATRALEAASSTTTRGCSPSTPPRPPASQRAAHTRPEHCDHVPLARWRGASRVPQPLPVQRGRAGRQMEAPGAPPSPTQVRLAVWPGADRRAPWYELPQPSTRRGRRVGGPVGVIHVGRSMSWRLAPRSGAAPRSMGVGDALAALPQRMAGAWPDRPGGGCDGIGARRIVAALSSLDGVSRL